MGTVRRAPTVLLGLLASGCFASSGASADSLLTRATFDMQCPGPGLQVVNIDVRTKGVRGCGKQMTYVEVCDNRPDGWHCTWVLNAPAWFVAPVRVPPRPEGTWWWTEPQGVQAPSTPGGPAPVAPPPFAPTPQPGGFWSPTVPPSLAPAPATIPPAAQP